MRLIFEDNDIEHIRDRWLNPPKYDEPPSFIVTFDVDIVDKRTGKTKNFVFKDVLYSGDYKTGYNDDFEEDARDYFDTERIEDFVWNFLTSNYPEYDSYDYEDLEIILNELTLDEKGSVMENFITEADENLKEQVAKYLDTILQESFEKGLVQNIANKVSGYDPEWSANNYYNSYKQAKNNFIDSIVKTLFANFNNK